MIKILIVDDHNIISEGLSALLSSDPQFDIVGIVSESKYTVRSVSLLRPDVVLMDFNMPGMTGLQVTEQLICNFPDIKVLILSIYNEQRHVKDFKKAGAKGYLLKSIDSSLLSEAIRKVYQGEILFKQDDLNAKNHIIHAEDDFLKRLRITKREREIIGRIMEGLSNKQIADVLCISINTIESQKKVIYRKIGVKNSVELINKMQKTT